MLSILSYVAQQNYKMYYERFVLPGAWFRKWISFLVHDTSIWISWDATTNTLYKNLFDYPENSMGNIALIDRPSCDLEFINNLVEYANCSCRLHNAENFSQVSALFHLLWTRISQNLYVCLFNELKSFQKSIIHILKLRYVNSVMRYSIEYI